VRLAALPSPPFDAGWENRIHWNHDFTGKAALAAIAKSPPRTVVAREWNADDIADIHRSQVSGLDTEPYMPIDLTGPSDVMPDAGTPDPVTGLSSGATWAPPEEGPTTVARFPYPLEEGNSKVDVGKIPRFAGD
jgi:hypothetical protein